MNILFLLTIEKLVFAKKTQADHSNFFSFFFFNGEIKMKEKKIYREHMNARIS